MVVVTNSTLLSTNANRQLEPMEIIHYMLQLLTLDMQQCFEQSKTKFLQHSLPKMIISNISTIIMLPQLLYIQYCLLLFIENMLGVLIG